MTRFTGTDVVCFRAERIVFEGLNFALEPSGALMLRGANGSGKSSLLRLMAGLSRPLSGTIAWNDTNITDDPEAHNRHFHYVGHADPVKPVLTAPADLWLLDEPQTALDSQASRSLDAAIADHRQQGGMVVMSSHAEAGLKDAAPLDLGDFQAQGNAESTGWAT